MLKHTTLCLALSALSLSAQGPAHNLVTNGDFTGSLTPWVMGGAYSVNAGHEVGFNVTGFNVSDSFGVNAGGLELSTDAKEVLQDLAAISQVQDALEESEDGEGDYMEVMEYLRVAPLLLFTETKKSAEPAAPKPSLH